MPFHHYGIGLQRNRSTPRIRPGSYSDETQAPICGAYLPHGLDEDRLLPRTFIAYLKSWTTRPAGTLLHGLDSMPIDEVVTLARNRRAWSRYVDSL